jgi:hypothetical protein
MITNAFLFMWNKYGIESIVPITQYEEQAKQDMWKVLKEEPVAKNPIDDIIGKMTMRARFNPEQHYEVYAMDCEEGITKEDLYHFWDTCPQQAADLTREKGVCLFSNRTTKNPIKIT